MSLLKWVSFAWMSAAMLCGQSLHVPPSQASLTTPGTFTLIMDAPEDRAPLALQWDLSLPPVLAVQAADITIGKAAQSAGKSLKCALRSAPKSARRTRYTCIVAGGRDPIGNGPVAEVLYRVQWDVKGAPLSVEIEHVLGVSRDLQRVPMSSVDAAISVR
jgi:hypothetical protein